jgi:hypothetical protein
MGADRVSDGTDTNAETVEEQPDRRPPPPPDKPGTDGYPTRADSRNGAAAANDTSTQNTEKQAETKPDTARPPQETSGEEDSTAARKKPEPETDNQPESAVAAERPEDKDTGKTSAADSANTAAPSAIDIGDRPDNEPKQTKDPLVSVTDAQELPRDSFDAPADVGDTRRELPRPAADSAEAAAQPPEGEGRSESADKPQVDARDQTFPVVDVNADAEQDANQAADGPRKQDEARDSGEDVGATPTERAETPGQRLERPDGEAEPEIKVQADAEAMGIVSKQALADRLMIHGVPLHEALDPVGAAAWSNEIGDQVADPSDRTGDWIADTDNTDPEKAKKERGAAFHKRFSREREGIADTAGKTTSKLQDLVSKRPPTGHLESRTGPDATPAPHQGLDAGDILTAGFAAGVMLIEGVRKTRGKIRQTRKA